MASAGEFQIDPSLGIEVEYVATSGFDPFCGHDDEQPHEDALQRIRLTELDVRISVTVLHSYDEAAHRCYAREVTVGFLVGVLRVLLVGGDELVVKIKVDTVSGVELSGYGQAPQQQGVLILVLEDYGRWVL